MRFSQEDISFQFHTAETSVTLEKNPNWGEQVKLNWCYYQAEPVRLKSKCQHWEFLYRCLPIPTLTTTQTCMIQESHRLTLRCFCRALLAALEDWFESTLAPSESVPLIKFSSSSKFFMLTGACLASDWPLLLPRSCLASFCDMPLETDIVI